MTEINLEELRAKSETVLAARQKLAGHECAYADDEAACESTLHDDLIAANDAFGRAIGPGAVLGLLNRIADLEARWNAVSERAQNAEFQLSAARVRADAAESRCTALEALAVELAGKLESIKDLEYAPQYHHQGMGCGVEDRCLQKDGYGAAEYGWEDAAERYAEWVIGAAEDAIASPLLAELRAKAEREREDYACPICHGTGWADPDAPEECVTCSGTGVKESRR